MSLKSLLYSISFLRNTTVMIEILKYDNTVSPPLLIILFVGDMANPWATECPERTLLNILSDQGCEGNVSKEDVAENTSLKVISALKEISALSSQIHAGELEVLQRNLHKNNKELVGLESLSQIGSVADQVTQSVSLILDNRDALLERIKTPHDPGRLVVEARYQSYAVSTFEKLGKVLTQLTAHIEDVEKFQRTRVCQQNIESSSKIILDLSHSLKTLYDNLNLHHRSLLRVEEQDSEHSILQI